MADYTPEQIAEMERATSLLHKLNGNPSARKHLEASVKVVMPEVETEDDVAARIAQPYVERVAKLEETVTTLATSLEAKDKAAVESREQADTEAAFGRLEGMGYQPAGIDAIKKLMVERKIADPEAAAALFDRMNPPVANEQPGWAPSSWSMESTAPATTDVKAMFQDPEAWADGEVGRALADVRRGVVG